MPAMNKRFLIVFLVCIIVSGLSIYSHFYTPKPSPSASPAVLNASDQKKGESRLYPNPSLTPGDVFSDVTTQEVCTSGYSSSVRDVPITVKKQVYAEYDSEYPQAK